jgi:hypothetical protein
MSTVGDIATPTPCRGRVRRDPARGAGGAVGMASGLRLRPSARAVCHRHPARCGPGVRVSGWFSRRDGWLSDVGRRRHRDAHALRGAWASFGPPRRACAPRPCPRCRWMCRGWPAACACGHRHPARCGPGVRVSGWFSRRDGWLSDVDRRRHRDAHALPGAWASFGHPRRACAPRPGRGAGGAVRMACGLRLRPLARAGCHRHPARCGPAARVGEGVQGATGGQAMSAPGDIATPTPCGGVGFTHPTGRLRSVAKLIRDGGEDGP